MQIVVIKAGDERFGINSRIVQQVIDNDRQITEVPKAETKVKGIIQHRGDLIPILDFNYIFNKFGNGEGKNIIVLQQGELIFGILVEKVEEVIDISEEEIENKEGERILKKKDKVITILDDIHSLI